MSNSWDDYYSHYIDWDDSHCFNVRIELKFEEELHKLGYCEFVKGDDFFNLEDNPLTNTFPKKRTYIKNENEIILLFEVPYDWSIDSDWEDKALILLGLKEEWVIDSSVEDN